MSNFNIIFHIIFRQFNIKRIFEIWYHLQKNWESYFYRRRKRNALLLYNSSIIYHIDFTKKKINIDKLCIFQGLVVIIINVGSDFTTCFDEKNHLMLLCLWPFDWTFKVRTYLEGMFRDLLPMMNSGWQKWRLKFTRWFILRFGDYD